MISALIILYLTQPSLGVTLGPLRRYGVKPVFEDDPELYVTWTTPYDNVYYWQYTPGSDYLGNLFAGKSEFPWIVNVQVDDTEKYTQATGNLITATAVLTSCRALVFFKKHYQNAYPVNITELEVVSRIRVFYCSIYLYEEMKKKKKLGTSRPSISASTVKAIPGQVLRPKGISFSYLSYDGTEYFGYTSGIRHVSQIVPHPKCSINDMQVDVAALILRTPISPVPPHVAYMPIFINLDLRIAHVDLANSTEQGKICYIASFGKDYSNWHDHYVVDYKVKYRVYFEDFDVCMKSYTFYECAELDSLDACQEPFYLTSDYEKFFCWKPRARVGAVCDQDRGAPLVCDGRVYGMVTRGLKFQYCSNLNPAGVIVLKASYIASYYMNFIDSEYRIWRKYKKYSRSSSPTHQVHAPIFLVSLLIFYSLSFLNFVDIFALNNKYIIIL